MEILTVPNLLTFFRLGLFGVFAWFLLQGRFWPAVSIFALSWALDAVDGWLARALHQESELGDQLDKWIDRIIIAFGILFFIRAGYLPDMAVFLLTKDIGLLPAMTIHAARNEPFRSLGLTGKLFTFVQGAAILYLLLSLPYQAAVITAVALIGGIIATLHLRRIV